MSQFLDQYGLTGQLIYDNAVAKLLTGEASVAQAMEYIMEFARGGWSLVVDENLEALADELAHLNYNVEAVPKGMSDDQIRKDYGGDVFITSNDADFDLSEVPGTFRLGLILVPNGVDPRKLAKAIERLLMDWRQKHGAAPVKSRINRGDL